MIADFIYLIADCLIEWFYVRNNFHRLISQKEKHTAKTKTTKAYKLLRVRKDGTLGSLFINKRAIIPTGKWLKAEDHPTKGYAHRPYYHCLPKLSAPHLSVNGRQWYTVELRGVIKQIRPSAQGGVWYLAKQMKVVKPCPTTQI